MPGMNKKIAFCTLGCKVNEYETNAMKAEFEKSNYEIIEFGEKADIYIINTCTVTNVADKKSRQMLRKAKELNKDAIVVAVGCYAQVSSDKILNEVPEVDLICGVNEKANIVNIIEEKLKDNSSKIQISDVQLDEKYHDFKWPSRATHTRAEIKIQDGCDRYCTYCAIPYARGKVRSRSIESTIEEAKYFAQKGVKEIVVTGIHIASYQNDLLKLLKELNDIDGIERIRISSVEPKLITKEFVTELSKLNKICDHFHLSLQSGCDSVLKRMNRRYTVEEFKKSVKILRDAYPNVNLTTDVIVGFPGETDEEFEITKKFLQDIEFYKLHVFEYSRRSGTIADKMPNQISPEVKKKRSKELIELSDEMQEKINSKYIGKEMDVLFEEYDGTYTKGHTSNYMYIKIREKIEQNTIKSVKLTLENIIKM